MTSRLPIGRRRVFAAGFLSILLWSPLAWPFSAPGEKTTYLHRRFLALNFDLGAADLIHTEGIEGRLGFGYRLGLSHPVSDSLAVDLQYQFTPLWIRSPDPLTAGQSLRSTFLFNQCYARLLYTYSRSWWQPYLFGGVGVYSFLGVDGRTALSFPANLEFPFGAGMNFYLSGNRLLLRSEFIYHWLRGENQSPAVLNVLRVRDIAFDVYSAWIGLVFAFY